jgi:hypothetical protein
LKCGKIYLFLLKYIIAHLHLFWKSFLKYFSVFVRFDRFGWVFWQVFGWGVGVGFLVGFLVGVWVVFQVGFWVGGFLRSLGCRPYNNMWGGIFLFVFWQANARLPSWEVIDAAGDRFRLRKNATDFAPKTSLKLKNRPRSEKKKKKKND